MRVKTLVSLIALLALAFVFAGCDEVPQQEIDDAKAALDAAKQAGADQYVADKYNAAKQALDNAMAVVQEEESAMFSNFDEARNQLAAAKTAAEEATAAVPAAKESVKQEVESILAQIPEEVKTAQSMWRKAPRGKGTREALQMIKADIENQEAAVADVQATFDSGDYLAARQQAQSIVSKLKSIQSELQR